MKTILLIDDDEVIRSSFGMALTLAGYKIIEADNGVSGLALARQYLPDLILTDINMPSGNGQALLHEIRADPDLCSKQVVMMTGRPDMVSPRNGMEQGADDFLLKPVTRDALLASVSARLNRAEIHWRIQDDALSALRGTAKSVLPHEFFTPLAGILGLSDILRSGSSQFSAEDLADLHQDIHLSALQLQRTLKNYLHMMEEPSASDPTDEWPRQVLASEALRQCLCAGVDSAVERHGRREDITVRWEKCALAIPGADLTLIVDELLDNALKFSRKGTAIVIQMTSNGELTITDGGRGMSDEQISGIGAFRQFDRKKYEQQGLGLGLMLVQKVALRNQGKFHAQRQIEGGLQVTVDFRDQAEVEMDHASLGTRHAFAHHGDNLRLKLRHAAS